jgi:ABC-type branched-subunit amino acid transport system substrate-binding protein
VRVRAALESINRFDGVTGTISFAPGQHIPRKDVSIVTLHNGAPVLAETINGM